MKQWTLSVVLVCAIVLVLSGQRVSAAGNIQDDEENEFAEFDTVDDKDQDVDEKWQQHDVKSSAGGGGPAKETSGGKAASMLRDHVHHEQDDADAEEFDHFLDDEEFEGQEFTADSETVGGGGSQAAGGNVLQHEDLPAAREADPSGGSAGGGGKPVLKITKVPLHLRANWPSYYAEAFMATVIILYFANYFSGRSKNMKVASSWFEAHKAVLESNFALVGDDGEREFEKPTFRKESDYQFLLWCSGRQNVDGLLVEMKLIKRQCILAQIMQTLKPTSDQISFKFHLEEIDPFVFFLATKKTGAKLSKEFVDIAAYCPDRKSIPEKAVQSFGDNLVVYSECPEVTASFFTDPRIVSWGHEFQDIIDYIHISDQFTPSNYTVDEQSKAALRGPKTEMVVLFGVAMSSSGKGAMRSIESTGGLMKLALHIVDKFSRFKLSKDAHAKADKRRQKVEEAYLKTTHQQRQELAQQRREDKIRAEREKILNEDDPEKQRKWELKEQKRQAKRSTPKMKQMKIRAM